MIWRRNKIATRRASWLAIFAILLQVILPPLHDAAMAAPIGPDTAHSLCLAPGSTGPAAPAKAPAHPSPGCAVCFAMQSIGGFAPPSAPVVFRSDDFGVATPASALIFLPRQWLHDHQQARAPPILV